MTSGVAILISDTLDFRTRNIVRVKERHSKMKTWSIHHEDVKIVNVYTPNHRNSKYTKTKLMEQKGEIGNSTTKVLDFGVSSQ